MAWRYIDAKENVGKQEKNFTANIKKNALSASVKADTQKSRLKKKK